MIKSEHHARLVVLYALYSAGCPVPTHILNDVLELCGVGSIGAAAEKQNLADNKHITLITDENVEYAVLTKTGESIITNLCGDISADLREKIELTTKREIEKLRRDLGVSAEIEQIPTGFKVTFVLRDDDEQLLSLNMFSPTLLQAEIMVENFKGFPYDVYRAVLASLTKPK